MKKRSLPFTVSRVLAALALIFAPEVASAADPTTADCLAASEASLTLARQHKLRRQRSQLLVCAASDCPADIRNECASRIDEVNAQIPTIIFEVKDPTGADLSAVQVTMDSEVVADRLEGTAFSVDPGDHAFTFESAGQPPITKHFLILQGQKDRREVVTLGTPAPAPAGATHRLPPPPAASQELGTQKILALVAGGAGVVGLGVGMAFGLVAISKKNDAQSACPGVCANQGGESKWSDAATAGNISTVAFVVGGVGVAAGAVLWLTAPGGSGAQVGMGPDGIQVRGAW